MADPFLGEIRLFAGNFAPAGWEFCEGQLLPIAQNDALFQLIGTTYGGDGRLTFALPDLRGRVPIHQGTLDNITFALAEAGGVEQVTLTTNQIPVHSHAFQASGAGGSSSNAANHVPANSPSLNIYIEDVTSANMAIQAVNPAGGNQPHTNMQPFLCVHFIIAVDGIFPSQ
jgi:microcystin-dependent protein